MMAAAEQPMQANAPALAPPPIRRGPELEHTRVGRLYRWKGETYWSVTSLIDGGMPKPALVPWAAKTVASWAVEHYAFLGQVIRDEGREEAIAYTAGARYRVQGSRARLGSSVHEAAEAYVLEQPYPEPTDEQRPYLEGFRRFLADFAPVYVAVEAPVFSRAQRYAGTLDAIVEIEHAELAFSFGIAERRPLRLLIDYKTGAGVYPEVALQLAAYRHAETFLGMPSTDEVPVPEVDGCAVLWLRPDGYSIVPVMADEAVFRAFLFVREVARFSWETGGNVLGREIRPKRGASNGRNG